MTRRLETAGSDEEAPEFIHADISTSSMHNSRVDGGQFGEETKLVLVLIRSCRVVELAPRSHRSQYFSDGKSGRRSVETAPY